VGTREVTASWRGGFRVDVDAGRFVLRVDEPEEVGGSDTGPQPTDLLLSSIASCFALAVVWSARKHEVPLGEVSVAVTGTYDGLRFGDVHLDVVSDLPADAAAAVIVSAQRVCYVTNTLRRPPSVTVGARSCAE
jgi:uncharacterized OsmC-like protein